MFKIATLSLLLLGLPAAADVEKTLQLSPSGTVVKATLAVTASSHKDRLVRDRYHLIVRAGQKLELSFQSQWPTTISLLRGNGSKPLWENMEGKAVVAKHLTLSAGGDYVLQITPFSDAPNSPYTLNLKG